MFKIGEFVTVKDKFWEIPSNISPDPDRIMYKYAGMTSKIVDKSLYDNKFVYQLEDAPWHSVKSYWSFGEEWLEPVEKTHICRPTEEEIMSMF